jgi:transcriptional regulator with PAS, ATPase and Fis domain
VDEGLKSQVEHLEKRLILAALEKTGGTQSLAAKELGISERVLRYKMKKYGLKLVTQLSYSNIIVDKGVRS